MSRPIPQSRYMNEKYQNSHDRIFGKKEEPVYKCEYCADTKKIFMRDGDLKIWSQPCPICATAQQNPMTEMKVISQYPKHHYVYSMGKTDLFCPLCGNKEVWVYMGEGDYYQGSEYLCVSCSSSHYLDLSQPCKQEPQFMVIEQLRTGITATPTEQNP